MRQRPGCRAREFWLAMVFGLLATVLHAGDPGRPPRTTPPPAPTRPSPLPPRFSVQELEGRWWFVSPEGRAFFSRGVCCVHPGTSHAAFDPENPGYAAWPHYATTAGWADASLRRLKAWGFTTLGGWSDSGSLRASREQTLCLTPVLHLGSTAGAPWWDMWDAKLVRRMDDVAREQILPLRDDPRLLGYYSDNELGWWNATLWKMTLEQPPSSGQRQRLIRLLRAVYQDDWRRLRQDFDPDNADSWRELRRGGMLYLKSGGDGIRVMRRFLALLAERYYQLMRDLIRKYDSRALFLGDRYPSFYYPEVARAAAPYVDAASSNLNAQWNDGTFLRAYLDTLYGLTRRPVLVSEFYLAATDNRSGNRNTRGVFPVVATQPERAAAARTTLAALACLPFVVGADWFQFADEPQHGRDDGENFNFGLVDIHDQPYEELTAMLATFDSPRGKAQPMLPQPDASAGIPPAPAEPFADFVPTRALKNWDRGRGFAQPVSEFPLADLYLAWKPEALYLGLYSLDIVEAAYYRDASVPKADRALWTVRVDGREVVHARIGAGREPLVSDTRVRLENLSGVNLDVRNIAALEIPAPVLGRERLRPGDRLELDCVLLTHCRAYRHEWQGRFALLE